MCDDANNNVECFFDGGDCCFNIQSVMCDECICYYGKGNLNLNKIVLSNDEKSLPLGDLTIHSYFDY